VVSALPAPRALRWNWSDALLGALCALPAAAVTLNDVSRGLAFAIGVLPALIVGVQPTRRRRPLVIVVGSLIGASIVVGSVLSHQPWLAVLGIFLLAVGAAELAGRRPVGRLLMTLGLPLVAVGLSYTDLAEACGLAAVMALGSVYACLVSLAWPEGPVGPARPVAPLRRDYGIRLGVAAAIAAAVGFALDFDHVGWACAAALLVMRPSAEMTQQRSVGRLAAVTAGAGAAVILANQTSSTAVYALATVVVLAAASATHTSRWYVTSAFTTFFAISLLIYADPTEGVSRFNERVLETVLGVGLAYFFGLVVPLVRDSTTPQGSTRPSK